MDNGAYTDKKVLLRYMALEQPKDRIQLQYVWIDGTGENLRAKTKTFFGEPTCAKDCPIWNFDGSSTGQASGHNSDVYLHPVALCADPLRGGKNKIVLCETYDHDGKPTGSNKRHRCESTMNLPAIKESKPWFGFEQEYCVMNYANHPFGWPTNGYPGPQGPYYCAVGFDKTQIRPLAEAHYRACLAAGLVISGINQEGMPSQAEYQVGPCEGIEAGDHVWLSRFLLCRVAEDFNLSISFDPKPVPGDWSGAGNHCNFSTLKTRGDKGLAEIYRIIALLKTRHAEHIKVYDPKGGKDNARRLTGLHETAFIEDFSVGIADRSASIRINRQVFDEGCGYLEDRRPASNCDPYDVTKVMVESLL